MHNPPARTRWAILAVVLAKPTSWTSFDSTITNIAALIITWGPGRRPRPRPRWLRRLLRPRPRCAPRPRRTARRPVRPAAALPRRACRAVRRRLTGLLRAPPRAPAFSWSPGWCRAPSGRWSSRRASASSAPPGPGIRSARRSACSGR
ncbi:hypothetical protein ACRAWF_38655 [Streptomyces sp. L7]